MSRCLWRWQFALAWLLLMPARAQEVETRPPITCLRLVPGGNGLLSASQRGVQVHAWPQLEEQRDLSVEIPSPHELQFSPDGSKLAIAGGWPAQSGQVEIVPWPAGEKRQLLRGHTDTVMALQWLDNRVLASASLDQQILVWDTDTGEQLLQLAGHSRGIRGLAYLPQQKLLVSGGNDQSLKVWDLGNGELLRNLVAHTQSVYQLATRPASEGLPMVASAGGDRTVRFWQPTIGRLVRFIRLPARPLDIRWHPSGQRLAAACTDGAVYSIDPETVTLLGQKRLDEGNWLYALECDPERGVLVAGGRDGRLFVVEENSE